MIPIPQYPLYSATITLLGGAQVNYFLDESKEWSFSPASLQKSYDDAVARGIEVRAIAVINPGNPTGQVLSRENIEDVLRFCHKNRVLCLADEVYQANTYMATKQFISFKKVLKEMGGEIAAKQELISYHSTSKGFLGECGFRGGYMETVNLLEDVEEQLYKLMSIGLCSNIAGQLMTELMINPPKPEDPSYNLYVQERDGILNSLARRAKKLATSFNKLEGVSCNDSEGAMYLFPRINLPERAMQEAEKLNMPLDAFYCLKLLERTGICTVPGSGFGQASGSYHFRTTFLPQESKIDKVVKLFADFHSDFMDSFRSGQSKL
jgi:alanine transaminase